MFLLELQLFVQTAEPHAGWRQKLLRRKSFHPCQSRRDELPFLAVRAVVILVLDLKHVIALFG
jgi:hypothetical protein